MKFTKGIVLSLASLFIAVTLMGCDTNYAKKSTENTALLALLLSVKSKGTACGVEKYSGNFFIQQVTLQQGVGTAPWDWNDCKPASAIYFDDTIASIPLAPGTPIVMDFTYNADNKVTSITETGNKVIPGSTAADPLTGCPAAGAFDTNVDVVQTTEFTYGANGEVAEKSVYQTCGDGDNKTPQDVMTYVYTYNSDKRPVSVEAYANVDIDVNIIAVPPFVVPATPTNEVSTNPAAVIDFVYNPASGVPTEVEITQTMYQVKITSSNAAFSAGTMAVSTDAGSSKSYVVPMDKGNLMAATAPTGDFACEAARTATSAEIAAQGVLGTTGLVMVIQNVCTAANTDDGMLMGADQAVTDQQASDRGSVSNYTIGLDAKDRLTWWVEDNLVNLDDSLLNTNFSSGTVTYDDQGRVVTMSTMGWFNYNEKTLEAWMSLTGATVTYAKQ